MSSGSEERILLAAQALFRAHPLILIGSGFSCGYGLPGMRALGSYLAGAVESSLTSDPAKALWAATLPAIATDLEGGLNTIASGTEGRDELLAILRSETAAYITRCMRSAEAKILMSDPTLHPPVRLLRRLFQGAPQNADCVNVITTNYDTLIELFCDLGDIPVDTGFTGFSRRRFRAGCVFPVQYRRSIASGSRGARYEHSPCLNIKLMKPHGSINWQMTPTGPIEVFTDISGQSRAIVVPGPSKYEDSLVSNLFDSLRAEMTTAVTRSMALVCIGFGFNDHHLQTSIRQRLEAGMPALILTREFTPNIKNVILRYPQVLGIERDGSGAVAHYDGDAVQLINPAWELDSFLKTFLE